MTVPEINHPELGDISEQRRWYSEGELFHHPAGSVYRAEKNPAGQLVWVLIQEPAK